jgi:hypothetical protein
VFNPNSASRQYLAAHLCKCGTGCVLQALLAVEAGAGVDETLLDFARVAPLAPRGNEPPFKTGLSDDFLAGRYGRKAREVV